MTTNTVTYYTEKELRSEARGTLKTKRCADGAKYKFVSYVLGIGNLGPFLNVVGRCDHGCETDTNIAL